MKSKDRSSDVLTDRRVGELLRIRLDGAEWWDVLEFVRAEEAKEGSAFSPQGGKDPMSLSQIRRLTRKADVEIMQSGARNRKKLIRDHLAVRRNLYAKSVLAGDFRTALACKRDEAELLGLYPPKRVKADMNHSIVKPVEFVEIARSNRPEGE
jgi:hypothetical protein